MERTQRYLLRRFRLADVLMVHDLLSATFKQFNAADCTQEGIDYHREFYTPDKIVQWTQDHTIVAEEDGEIIGFGRAKADGWITHVFVGGNHMRRGVGRDILLALEKWLRASGRRFVYLNSSRNAIGFYTKHGYKPHGEPALFKGIPLQPMRKELMS